MPLGEKSPPRSPDAALAAYRGGLVPWSQRSRRPPGDCYFLHSVGGSRVRSGLRRCRLTWVAVTVAVLAVPATTAVASPPAVDQYTQHLPGAGGGSGLASGSAPVSRPWLLSPKTRS